MPTTATITNVDKADLRSIGFTVSYEGRCIDLMSDTNDVNVILHKCLNIRQRLDVAHLRMGWPLLDDLEYDDAGLIQLMNSAAQDIYREAGMDALAIAAVNTADAAHGKKRALPARVPLTSRSKMHAKVYAVILGAPDIANVSPA